MAVPCAAGQPTHQLGSAQHLIFSDQCPPLEECSPNGHWVANDYEDHADDRPGDEGQLDAARDAACLECARLEVAAAVVWLSRPAIPNALQDECGKDTWLGVTAS